MVKVQYMQQSVSDMIKIYRGNIKGHTSDLKGVICTKFIITEQHTNKSELNLML